MSHKKSSSIPVWLIVLIILVIIIIFVATLGSVNPGDAVKFPEAFKDSKEEAKRKHKRLKEHIEKQEALKVKLNKKFKRTYFFVRLTMVIIWFVVLGVLYFFKLISNLGDALTYSEAMVLLLVIVNFLTFGSITNMNEFIDTLKIKTENWIYSKYKVLDKAIESNKMELEKLEDEIKPTAQS